MVLMEQKHSDHLQIFIANSMKHVFGYVDCSHVKVHNSNNMNASANIDSLLIGNATLWLQGTPS